jgi:hypothetical protein
MKFRDDEKMSLKSFAKRRWGRHLYQNFHKNNKGETLKNNLWAIERSINVPTWDKNMEKMKTDSPSAFFR